jgi:hypothetical protein
MAMATLLGLLPTTENLPKNDRAAVGTARRNTEANEWSNVPPSGVFYDPQV